MLCHGNKVAKAEAMAKETVLHCYFPQLQAIMSKVLDHMHDFSILVSMVRPAVLITILDATQRTFKLTDFSDLNRNVTYCENLKLAFVNAASVLRKGDVQFATASK